MLALLAFACFPVFAQADSVGSQYETEIPDVPKETKEQNSVDEPKAGDSKDGGYTAPDTPETDGESESTGVTGGNQGSDGGNKDGGASAGKDGGTSQGNPGNGSSGANQTALGEAAPLATSPQPVDDGDGGSSSPLVPILIAIAALAAISIGAVVIRQRRQGDGSGSQISPKAS